MLNTSQGLGAQKTSEVGTEEDAETNAKNTMPAGSGDKDQIRASICDLEPIAQFNKPSRLLSNKLEGSTKKKLALAKQ